MSTNLCVKNKEREYKSSDFSNGQMELDDYFGLITKWLIEEDLSLDCFEDMLGQFDWQRLNSYGCGNIVLDEADVKSLLVPLKSLNSEQKEKLDKAIVDANFDHCCDTVDELIEILEAWVKNAYKGSVELDWF